MRSSSELISHAIMVSSGEHKHFSVLQSFKFTVPVSVISEKSHLFSPFHPLEHRCSFLTKPETIELILKGGPIFQYRYLNIFY